MTKSIGQTAREFILSMPGATNQEILDKVLEVHTEAKTTLACIAWYKSDMKKNKVTASAPRTEETVQTEINILKEKLEQLECELGEMQEANKEKFIAEYLAAKKKMQELGLEPLDH